MKIDTKLIHNSKTSVDPNFRSVNPPIYQTSTFAQHLNDKQNEYEYSRTANPTRTAVENAIASLEQGDYGVAFSSGIAAVDAVLKLLKAGDEVITSTQIYGGTYRIFNQIYKKFGIVFHFLDLEAHRIEDYINSYTKLIWVETPTNPLLSLIDIKALAQISSPHGILLVVDNTFASPYLQQPLLLGADIVMHSASKYLGGHSDVIFGALVVRDKGIADKLYFIQKATGAIPGPMDCYLVFRGIKTLHVRMKRHCQNTKAIAQFLKTHPKVEHVYWPGFKSHPNHSIALEQMSDFGGVVSFSLKENTQNSASTFINRLKLITLAESLGGVESLIGHPASMSHASVPKQTRINMGIGESLMRLSVGIEDAEDILIDLKKAFEI